MGINNNNAVLLHHFSLSLSLALSLFLFRNETDSNYRIVDAMIAIHINFANFRGTHYGRPN